MFECGRGGAPSRLGKRAALPGYLTSRKPTSGTRVNNTTTPRQPDLEPTEEEKRSRSCGGLD